MNQKPIRSLAAWHASYKEWEAAHICCDQHPDKEERQRAHDACIVEERRWNECEGYFNFDPEEGYCTGLKRTSYMMTNNGHALSTIWP